MGHALGYNQTGKMRKTWVNFKYSFSMDSKLKGSKFHKIYLLIYLINSAKLRTFLNLFYNFFE